MKDPIGNAGTGASYLAARYQHHRTADDGRDHLMSHIMFVPSRREIDIRKPLPLAGTVFDPRRYRRP